jgi:hypothetical protein
MAWIGTVRRLELRALIDGMLTEVSVRCTYWPWQECWEVAYDLCGCDGPTPGSGRLSPVQWVALTDGECVYMNGWTWSGGGSWGNAPEQADDEAF